MTKRGRPPVFGETRTKRKELRLSPEQFNLLRGAGLGTADAMLKALIKIANNPRLLKALEGAIDD